MFTTATLARQASFTVFLHSAFDSARAAPAVPCLENRPSIMKGKTNRRRMELVLAL
jgi:hypothetical protein